MKNHKVDFEKLRQRIEEILYDYVAVPSFTNTPSERKVERFFMQLLGENPYFRAHPQFWGLYEVENDRLDRRVCWGMVRGRGEKAVVLVHHYDVVDVEDYKTLKDKAFSPDQLREALLQHRDMLQEDARKDLDEDTFLFGRGTCDMKGGGAIQYALLEAYSELAEQNELEGNVIVIGVPDEENLSSGMRSAVKLLAKLKREYGLEYQMMFNSEPHQRKDFTQGIFSEGSVGKMMPFVYVRGFLSHAGKVFEGLNPVSVLSEIVSRTETNMDFADVVFGEAAPPPTWLYLKDSKDWYDVSMPLSAQGCFSVLTLKQTPKELMEKVAHVCEEAMTAVIERMNRNYRRFAFQLAGVTAEAGSVLAGKLEDKSVLLPWHTKIVTFRQLYEEAAAYGGEAFQREYEKEKERILADMENRRCSMIEGNFRLIDAVYNFVEDISPRVVYGLLPPYYPNVSNLYFTDAVPGAGSLFEKLYSYTEEHFGQTYTREYFYTGICDLSYINIKNPEAERTSLVENMALLGDYYDIPFEEIKEISMAGMNIGPWGKDFHKLTERVCKEDLYERTPKILDAAIAEMLKE